MPVKRTVSPGWGEVRPEIDLRWEVAASPTEEMWEAMRSADLGMGDFGEDRAVNELEALGAEMTGQEAAVLLPTVTAGTIMSIMDATRPGSVVLMEQRCHIYWVEEGHVSALAGVSPLLVRGDKFGMMSTDSLQEAVDEDFYGHARPVSMVCLENTHNICGGTIGTVDYVENVAEFGHRIGAKVYMDGARLFNAAVTLGVPLAQLAAPVDYVVLGLNKGLAAPYGALLCSSAENIKRARIIGRRLGAMSLHRSGIYAAAGLIGMNSMVARLKEDHDRASTLAAGIADLPGLRVDMETVQTNLVRVDTLEYAASDFALHMAQEGIAVHAFEPNAFKFATHLEITDEHIDRAIETTRRVANTLAQRV